MKLTLELLKRAMPGAGKRADVLWTFMSDAMWKGDITDPLDIAAFIATVGHESLDLLYMAEIASGRAYEGRADLGNTHPGDGVAYKGRGPIQVTGLYNYQKFSIWSGYDAVASPKLLEQPFIGFLASVWFWKTNGLTALAKSGDFLRVQVRVNGRNKVTGLPNGWDDRQKRYDVAMKAMPVMA